MHDSTEHQRRQIEVIDQIERSVADKSVAFSTVDPVEDYDADSRMTITSVHFPHQNLIVSIRQIVEPLRLIQPEYYYYRDASLHFTVKNVRVVNDPPRFTKEDVEIAYHVFNDVVPRHKAFKVYYYRLFLFPSNLALVGTTDPELDALVLDLDEELRKAGIGDDKLYINKQYFFSNITLARFTKPLSQEYLDKVFELSQKVKLEPYTVDSVSLIVSNASLYNCEKIGEWKLKS